MNSQDQIFAHQYTGEVTMGHLHQWSKDRSNHREEVKAYFERHYEIAYNRARYKELNPADSEDVASNSMRVLMEYARAQTTVQVVPSDFNNCEQFVSRLKQLIIERNPAAELLYRNFTPQLRSQVDACNITHRPDSELEVALAQELTLILRQYPLEATSLSNEQEITQLTDSQQDKILLRNRKYLFNIFKKTIARPRDPYNPESPVYVLFNSIVEKQIQSRLKSLRRERRIFISLDEHIQEEESIAERYYVIPDKDIGPEIILVYRDIYSRCAEELKDRKIYLALAQRGFNYQQIASQLNITLGQSRGRTARAVGSFHKCLEKNGINIKNLTRAIQESRQHKAKS